MVSVVIPTYNRALYLRQAIKSVLMQTYKKFEIIVVDDGSTDNTKDVVSQWPQVRYINQENQRIAVARNTGMKNAKGEYIAFLDSDDLWAPEHLQRCVQILEENDHVGLVGGSHAYFNDNGKILKTLVQSASPEGKVLKDMFLKNTPFQTSTVVMRQNLLSQVGYFNPKVGNGLVGEDYEFFCRIIKHTQVAYVKEILVFYRTHADNITNKYDLCVICNSKRYVANLFPELLPLLCQAEAEVFARAGYLSLHRGSRMRGLKYFIGSILRCPFCNPMGWFYPYKGLLKCVLPKSLYRSLKSRLSPSIELSCIDDIKWRRLWDEVSLHSELE